VGSVYEQFELELDGWREKYAGRPDREMMRIFFLALEREEIVSVGYREELIHRRLQAMPLPEEARDLMRHALVWAWKDEQMHTIYIRGVILKRGNAHQRLMAFIQQAAGAVGGWAASARQHLRFRDAPLSSSLATLITWIGSITGKVPKDVRRHLYYLPFRDFCLFNVEAEKTAWLCWSRLLDIVNAEGRASAEFVEDVRRMRDDEYRHSLVFAALAEAVDEHDRLAGGETIASLAEKIRAAGEAFLPRARRSISAADNPFGSGGRVTALAGQSAEEKLPLFNRLLDEAGLKERLSERARRLGKSVTDLRVVIKPTFMLGYHRKDLSTITDAELVAELAIYLRRQGCADVAVVEARNIYDSFYRNRTVHDVARYFNFDSPAFRVLDASEEQVPHDYLRGMGQYTVSRTWKEADFRITFGKMRSHPVEMVYLTVGNLEGLGARCEEFFFAERQAHRETANLMLVDQFPPHFAILDAYDLAPDGLLGMMGCPRPKSPRRFYAGCDAIAVDMVAARHMGLGDPRQSLHLRAACHWFGDPTDDIEAIGVSEPIAGWRGPYHNEWSALLSLMSYPVYQYASSRGAVFVPEMDEDAFPPVTPEGFILRARRRSLQALLGLRHKKSCS
jgi:uncharacterized protein (DUF362 family)